MALQHPLYRVIYEDAFWLVVDGKRRVSVPLLTQADAVIRAKELAVENGSARIVVEDDTKKIVSDFVYQRDERHALQHDEAPLDSYYASHSVSRPSHRER
jgi:hypothetical protein